MTEVHDTHHPIASSLHYEDQKPEALPAAPPDTSVPAERLPKFLSYFERVLEKNDRSQHRTLRFRPQDLTYVDLSHVPAPVAGIGLRSRTPCRALRRAFRCSWPCAIASPRPTRIAAYLASRAADRVQPVGDLPVLQGAGRVGEAGAEALAPEARISEKARISPSVSVKCAPRKKAATTGHAVVACKQNA